MMLEKNTRKCPLNDEIVSYMYGELVGRDSDAFETHLADCTVCTDEFAAVSNVRFSVYEWQKEHFAPLPTPSFAIPYEPRPVAATGFFAGLRELLAMPKWPVTVAAAVVAALGVGFVAVNFIGGDEPPVASNVRAVERPSEPTQPQPLPDVRSEASEPEAMRPEVATAVEKRPVRVRKATSADKANAERPEKKATTAKAPVLTNFDEDADTSLRLADLFDGVGS